MARWRAPAAITVMVAVVVVASCAACAGDEAAPPTSTIGSVAVATAVPVPVGSPTPSSGVSPATSDSPSARAPTTTVAATTSTTQPGIAGRVSDAVTVREVGRSVEGRPITAVERGDPGGVPVVVLGAIHGDEDDGVAILERLASAPLPPGVDLWLLESMNPDGQAAEQRGNANGVDLNRNFPHDWAPIAQPGDGEYAGTGPASEPETRAVVEFLTELEPALVLWYHQDLFRLSPGTGFEGRVKQRYAELTGLPIDRITGGTYTGVAATWTRTTTDAISFIVELGPTLSPAEADTHAAAVLDIATMVANA